MDILAEPTVDTVRVSNRISASYSRRILVVGTKEPRSGAGAEESKLETDLLLGHRLTDNFLKNNIKDLSGHT